MSRILSHLADVIIPPACAACGELIKNEELFICEECFIDIPGLLLTPNEINNCRLIKENHVDGLISLLAFEKKNLTQHLIHTIKYRSNFILARQLGRQIAKKYEEELQSFSIDYIAPIPSHPIKYFKRGYNQASELAKGLKDQSGITLKSSLLKRTKYKASQTTYNYKDRQKNILGVFGAGSEKEIKNKNILIVDDVITTGATLSQCSNILKEKRAKKIFALSLALVL